MERGAPGEHQNLPESLLYLPAGDATHLEEEHGVFCHDTFSNISSALSRNACFIRHLPLKTDTFLL